MTNKGSVMPQSFPVPAWIIHIYRVKTRWHQQRILSTLACIGGSGIVATDVRSGSDWFVILECSTSATEIDAMRVVVAIDPDAVRTYEFDGSGQGVVYSSSQSALPLLRVLQDGELWVRGRDGERLVYEVLCSRHSYLAGRFARKLGFGIESRQVVADAFMHALVTHSTDRTFRDVVLEFLRSKSRGLSAKALQ